MAYEILIAKIRNFSKGDKTYCIVDGLIIGLGIVSLFVQPSQVKNILEGEQREVIFEPVVRMNRLELNVKEFK